MCRPQDQTFKAQPAEQGVGFNDVFHRFGADSGFHRQFGFDAVAEQSIKAEILSASAASVVLPPAIVAFPAALHARASK